MKSKRIAIIGGGLTGMVAAYRLLQKGHKVTIYEKNKELGGLMGGFEINGTNLEKAYHHIFKTDKAIIKLARELGLQDKLEWKESSIGLYYNGNIHPFATPLEMLKFPPLALIDKIRMGVMGLYLQKTTKWQQFEKITAVDWCRKNFGENVYKVVWEPLLKGKFHNFYDKVSMAWLWARIHTRGNSKDRDGKERLGYFWGGFNIITQELTKRIIKNKGKIETEAMIESIKQAKTGINIRMDGKNLKYDRVIATIPGVGLSKLIGETEYPRYSAKLNRINYLGAVLMIFTSKQSLSKYYWHNINDTSLPFLAFIQHTNLIDKSNYGDENVYYIGTYLPHTHKYFESEDKLIEKEFFEGLRKIFPDFDPKKVNQKFVFKLKNAQHVVELGYEKMIPRYQTPIKGLYLANFSQIYPEDRGTNYAVAEGEKIANLVG